jgi:hypothetical protein
MSVVTKYRLAEQVFNLIESGHPSAASSISFNELKIACGNVINAMLKTEYVSINGKTGETIPNNSVFGWYENIDVSTWNGKSKAKLPIKPLQLPRNIGLWAVYPKYEINGDYDLDKEFIPIQAGQSGLLKSQPMINDLMGQTGYEPLGGDSIVFNVDIKTLFPDIKLAMKLIIMDINQYGDWDMLPVPPEMEFDIVQSVYKLYSSQSSPDKIVDSTVKENKNVPLNQQKQS